MLLGCLYTDDCRRYPFFQGPELKGSHHSLKSRSKAWRKKRLLRNKNNRGTENNSNNNNNNNNNKRSTKNKSGTDNNSKNNNRSKEVIMTPYYLL